MGNNIPCSSCCHEEYSKPNQINAPLLNREQQYNGTKPEGVEFVLKGAK